MSSRNRTIAIILTLAAVGVFVVVTATRAADTDHGEPTQEQETHIPAEHGAGCDHQEHDHGGETHADEPQAEHHEEHQDAEHTADREDHDHAADDQAEHEAEADHDDHEGHDHGERAALALTDEQIQEIGIQLDTVAAGTLEDRISAPGEVVVNADRLAHIVPPASGVVRQVLANTGDRVEEGQVLAWLDSRELGETKVAFLAKRQACELAATDLDRAQAIRDNTLKLLDLLETAPSLEALREMDGAEIGENRSLLISAYAEYVFARTAHDREKQLYEKKITSESDYLAAEGEFKKAEANYLATRDSVRFAAGRSLMEAQRTRRMAEFERKAAERTLHVLGLSEDRIAALTDLDEHDEALMRYPLRAPFDGTIIEKHISLGEVLKDDAEVFVVADMSTVWVDLRVYQRDLAEVGTGQSVVVSAGHGIPDAPSRLSYVGAVVDPTTRTTVARAVLDNPQGVWRPGLFVTGTIATRQTAASHVVAKDAVQTIEGRPCVFVQTEEGFEPQPVVLGRENDGWVEIAAGLKTGQRYVSRGAFDLKARIATSTMDSHAGHGH